MTSPPQLMTPIQKKKKIPGRVALSVMCLATDACLTADPGSDLDFIRTCDTNNKFIIFSDSLSVLKAMSHTSSKNPQIQNF